MSDKFVEETSAHQVLVASIKLGLSLVKILVEARADVGADPLEGLSIVQFNVTHVSPVDVAASMLNTIVV